MFNERWQFGFRLGTVGIFERCTTELLDRNPAAVILLDDRNHVSYANRSAEALCSTGDGIQLSANGVIAHAKQDNDKMQTSVTEALSPEALAGHGGAMRINPAIGQEASSSRLFPENMRPFHVYARRFVS